MICLKMVLGPHMAGMLVVILSTFTPMRGTRKNDSPFAESSRVVDGYDCGSTLWLPFVMGFFLEVTVANPSSLQKESLRIPHSNGSDRERKSALRNLL